MESTHAREQVQGNTHAHLNDLQACGVLTRPRAIFPLMLRHYDSLRICELFALN